MATVPVGLGVAAAGLGTAGRCGAGGDPLTLLLAARREPGRGINGITSAAPRAGR